MSEAANKLSAMLGTARESSSLIEAIADASKEQAAAIEQTEAQATELDKIVDAFSIDGEAAAMPVETGKPGTARALQQKVKAAVKSYLSNGNAAVKQDWAEF